jgi:predicted HicB family RNase H-like nuclease
MTSNYREILAQAKQEKQKSSKQESRDVGKPESIEVDNHTSIQADNEELVNLCVRVPKSWRTKVKAAAVNHNISLGDLVVEAIERYMEQEEWS